MLGKGVVNDPMLEAMHERLVKKYMDQGYSFLEAQTFAYKEMSPWYTGEAPVGVPEDGMPPAGYPPFESPVDVPNAPINTNNKPVKKEFPMKWPVLIGSIVLIIFLMTRD